MKKTYLLILFLALIGNMVGCKDNNEPTLPLDGVWLEQSDRLDTIRFVRLDNGPYLSLDRGREIRNGEVLPKYGSGLYNYQIKGDSISLLNLSSSCSSCYKTYYFVIKGAELRIGDFYEKNSPNPQPLIFIKD
ncbi:hypothetical protein FVR03_24125 [Pontibacter qinzhouensis]|uniref:Uncharacterized protein n=1 Tax=Pontibacter qinzhouensis TaxID=2603253 RepID=A0A5C8IC58_9BACT|nr:hypothetical protein [Pontibacter qinzhouensis]TXK18367.1 hypothetical protein FVR03_24125 [Pontibacter qinzhouensis]